MNAILSSFTERDLDLASRWAGEKIGQRRVIKDKLAKMIIARAGELAAKKIIERFKFNVVDVAIMETYSDSAGNDDRWLKYDLEVLDVHNRVIGIDVKTSRQKRDNSISEFLIQDVSKYKNELIAGVYADMVYELDFEPSTHELSIKNDWIPGLSLAGFVNIGELNTRISSIADNKFLNAMTLKESLSFKPEKLPFWVYSVQSFLSYTDRISIKNLYVSYIRLSLKTQSPDELLRDLGPGLIPCLGLDGLRELKDSIPDSFFRVFAEVAVTLNQISFPVAYLSLIYEWMSCHREGGRVYNTKFIDDLLYHFGFGKDSHFLGIFDTGGNLKNFSYMLEEISNIGRGLRINTYKYFKFNLSKMILKGQLADEDDQKKIITLFAFCGGNKLNSNHKCNTQRLNISQNETCTECGYLICQNCFSCQSGCSNQKRRRNIAKFDSSLCYILDHMKVYSLDESNLSWFFETHTDSILDELLGVGDRNRGILRGKADEIKSICPGLDILKSAIKIGYFDMKYLKLTYIINRHGAIFVSKKT